jgi:flagellin
MAMVINSNIASLTSQRHLSQSRNDMEVAMERMSSGRRINSSMDDAAGLAIGNRMTSQIEGLNQAIRNANDGISLAQTAESALDSHSGILQRIRVLAVQSANDTYSTLDRKTLNNEIVQLKEELNRSVSEAAFNGQKILDGSSANFTFQIGHTAQDTVDISLSNMSGSQIGTQTWADKAGVTAPTTTTVAYSAGPPATAETGSYDFSSITMATGDRITLTIGSETYIQEYATDQETTLNALGALVVNGETGYVSKGVVNGALVFVGNADGTAIAAATMAVETATVTAANSIDDVLVTDSVSAKHALTVVDNALEMMADFRSRMGAVSNRMFHTIDNLMSVSENTSAARSRIVDADFAAESASLAKSQILQKAGTAMLSQANASTQDILSLLK